MLRDAGTIPCAHIIVISRRFWNMEEFLVASVTAIYLVVNRTHRKTTLYVRSLIMKAGLVVKTKPRKTKKKVSKRNESSDWNWLSRGNIILISTGVSNILETALSLDRNKPNIRTLSSPFPPNQSTIVYKSRTRPIVNTYVYSLSLNLLSTLRKTNENIRPNIIPTEKFPAILAAAL